MNRVNTAFAKNKRKIRSISRYYFVLAFSLLFSFVLIRLFDFSNVFIGLGSDIMSFKELLKVIGYDIMLSFSISGLLFTPFLLLSLLSKTTARLLYSILFFVIVLLSVSLVIYFSKTMVPLDQVIFIYNYESIVHIIGSSGGLDFVTLWPVIFILLCFLSTLFLLSKIKLPRLIIKLFVIIILLAGASLNLYIIKPNKCKNELNYYCNVNKFVYFSKAVGKYYKTKKSIDNVEVSTSVNAMQSADIHKKKYIGSEFSFLYKRQYNSSLAPFFRSLPKGEKPNIVFIIVESLSNSLSGKYAKNVSLTPFLDSLSSHALYWRNALAVAERTFGVLPAVLASLPHGESGFMKYHQKFPLFQSFPKLLKENNYSTQMFYGGWSGFTDMDKFITAVGIDTIYENYDGNIKMPTSDEGFSWGYGDDVVFQYSFEKIRNDKPYFNLFLTLSSHSPFLIHNQEKYVDLTSDIISKMPEGKEKDYTNKYISELSTYVFVDEQIKLFVEKYKKRDDFKNTIFVIAGDHKGMLYNNKSSLEKYHVPLMIYSPLLNRSKEIGGIVTLNDVVPSLIALLNKRYGFKAPFYGHELGADMDTNSVFAANNQTFFMRNSREVNEYLKNEYFLDNDILYKVSDHLKINRIEDDSTKMRLKEELIDFKKVQKYSVESNALIPVNAINVYEKN